MKREMSVCGTFYPARAIEIERYFQHFNSLIEEQEHLTDLHAKTVIVPHAGYIYSGFTANIAYRILAQSNLTNFLVIGPSHRVALDGLSIGKYESYETPFGDLLYAEQLFEQLQTRFQLTQSIEHAEHSTEVQFPFIKHYLPHAKIVEIIYGRVSPSVIAEIIDFALSLQDTGVIISTDLSHFYSLQEANTLDSICLDAIEALDVSILHRGCEACGLTGIEAMMLSARRNNLKPHLLDYRTSADASDNASRVVGYVSA